MHVKLKGVGGCVGWGLGIEPVDTAHFGRDACRAKCD